MPSYYSGLYKAREQQRLTQGRNRALENQRYLETQKRAQEQTAYTRQHQAEQDRLAAEQTQFERQAIEAERKRQQERTAREAEKSQYEISQRPFVEIGKRFEIEKGQRESKAKQYQIAGLLFEEMTKPGSSPESLRGVTRGSPLGVEITKDPSGAWVMTGKGGKVVTVTVEEAAKHAERYKGMANALLLTPREIEAEKRAAKEAELSISAMERKGEREKKIDQLLVRAAECRAAGKSAEAQELEDQAYRLGGGYRYGLGSQRLDIQRQKNADALAKAKEVRTYTAKADMARELTDHIRETQAQIKATFADRNIEAKALDKGSPDYEANVNLIRDLDKSMEAWNEDIKDLQYEREKLVRENAGITEPEADRPMPAGAGVGGVMGVPEPQPTTERYRKAVKVMEAVKAGQPVPEAVVKDAEKLLEQISR